MRYYKKAYIQHLLVEGVSSREFAMLGSKNCNIRALKARNYYELIRGLELANWDKNKPNLYRSVAKLKSIPEFTFNPKKRSSETNPWFLNQFDSQIVSYDLFFDFDDNYRDENGKKVSGTWEEITSCVKILKEYLDEYKVPYSLIFSGNKGFQIIIPGELLEIDKIENGNVFPHKMIQENIKNFLGLKFLDLSNNGVNSRLCKVPYSLVLTNKGEINLDEGLLNHQEEKMNVALPLCDEQFNNFKIEDMSLSSVLCKVKGIKNRGDLCRFSNLTMEDKRDNLAEFIKLLSFK